MKLAYHLNRIGLLPKSILFATRRIHTTTDKKSGKWRGLAILSSLVALGGSMLYIHEWYQKHTTNLSTIKIKSHFSKSTRELLCSGLNSAYKKNYSNAALCFEQACQNILDEIDNFYTTMNSQVLLIQIYLLEFYYLSNEKAKYEELLNSLYKRCKQKAIENDEIDWHKKWMEMSFLLGSFIFKEKHGNLNESESILSECLTEFIKERQKIGNQSIRDSLRWMKECSTVMMTLGEVYLSKNMFHKAYPLFVESFKMFEQAEAHEKESSWIDSVLCKIFNMELNHRIPTQFAHDMNRFKKRSLYYYYLSICLHGIGYFQLSLDMINKAIEYYRYTKDDDQSLYILYYLQKGQTEQALNLNNHAIQSYNQAIQLETEQMDQKYTDKKASSILS